VHKVYQKDMVEVSFVVNTQDVIHRIAMLMHLNRE